MSAPPSGPEEITQVIAHSRVAIGEGAVYYYNAQTGTRYISFSEFAELRHLDDAALARQLDEIAQHSTRRNRHSHPEVAFFGVDSLRFGGPNFVGQQFARLAPGELRERYKALCLQFEEATRPELREDDPRSATWQEQMFAAIAGDEREELVRDPLPGLISEFSPRIRWLPGGRFEEGEFIFAPVFPKEGGLPHDAELEALWDPLARGFIANFIREYGNIEYLNLGRVEAGPAALAPNRGRRGVYLAEIKVRGEANPRALFLRVQRWGIRERLEEKDEQGRPKELVRAVLETEEYVDYILDRRLGCLQFGMHLPARVNMRRTTETYIGSRHEFEGLFFPVIYYERDYLPGIPTNKVPERKLADPRYALGLARLLGKAAAPNIVVGRTRNPLVEGMIGQTLFDDGDEIIIEGSDGLPRELVLVDHSGAFADWKTSSLLLLAKGYAAPVNTRADKLPDPQAFAQAYVGAFREEFVRIQSDYRLRRGAFDGLFRHLPYNENGSFACRWMHVLKRLHQTDVDSLVSELSRHMTVLG
jgi:hypothetical protein